MAAVIYGTATGFDTYVEDRGYTVPAGDTDTALIRATDYIDAKYGMRFSGTKTGGRAQERQQPRTGQTDSSGEAIDEDEIPVEVINATYEAALLELASPGVLQKSINPAGVIKRVAVEGAVEVEYANTEAHDQVIEYPIIDGILATLLSTNVDYGSGLFGRASRV